MPDVGLRPATQFNLSNRFIRNSTLTYMLLNVGHGMLDVLIPHTGEMIAVIEARFRLRFKGV